MGLSTEVIVAIVTSGCAAISSIFVAVISYSGQNRMKQRDMQDAQYRAQQALINAKREQQHKERQYLYDALLRGLDASLAANEISLIALNHGHLMVMWKRQWTRCKRHKQILTLPLAR